MQCNSIHNLLKPWYEAFPRRTWLSIIPQPDTQLELRDLKTWLSTLISAIPLFYKLGFKPGLTWEIWWWAWTIIELCWSPSANCEKPQFLPCLLIPTEIRYPAFYWKESSSQISEKLESFTSSIGLFVFSCLLCCLVKKDILFSYAYVPFCL